MDQIFLMGISNPANKAGLQFINPQILTDAFMNVKSQYSEGIATLLINDRNRYLRINHNDGTNLYELDGVTKKQIESVIGIGKETARYYKNDIFTKFFSNKTEIF